MSDRGTQPPPISWTPAKLAELKLAWKLAEQDSHDVFVFEGQALATGYVKYLIIYLEGTIK
jgi:HEPN domain-containing protein